MELRGLVRGFAALSSGYAVGKCIGLVAVIALARFVPADHLGRYATIITFVGYLQAITNWGSDALGIRSAAQAPGSAASLAGAVVESRSVVGVLPLGALLLGLFWHGESVSSLAAVAAAWLAFLFRADWLLLARGKSAAVGIWVAVREAVFASLAISVIRASGSVESALWSYATAEWVWSIGTRWRLFKSGETGGARSLSPRELISLGFPLALVSITVLTSNKVDVPILAHYRKSSEVAAYWTAYNIMFAAMLLSAMWDRVALATMSRQVAEGTDHGRGPSLHFSILGGVLGTAIALVLHGLAKPILHVAYSGRFDAAATALSVLALALPAIYLSGILAGRLVAEARQGRWAFAAASGAILNLGLNFVLIPKWGMEGAAITTLASEWVVFLVIASNFRKAAVFRAFVANVGYLMIGIAISVGLVLHFGPIGGPWITLVTAAGFLAYAVPIITQQLPQRLRLRQPIRGLWA